MVKDLSRPISIFPPARQGEISMGWLFRRNAGRIALGIVIGMVATVYAFALAWH